MTPNDQSVKSGIERWADTDSKYSFPAERSDDTLKVLIRVRDRGASQVYEYRVDPSTTVGEAATDIFKRLHPGIGVDDSVETYSLIDPSGRVEHPLTRIGNISSKSFVTPDCFVTPNSTFELAYLNGQVFADDQKRMDGTPMAKEDEPKETSLMVKNPKDGRVYDVDLLRRKTIAEATAYLARRFDLPDFDQLCLRSPDGKTLPEGRLIGDLPSKWLGSYDSDHVFTIKRVYAIGEATEGDPVPPVSIPTMRERGEAIRRSAPRPDGQKPLCIGDTVRLRSGGPAMTVIDVSGQTILCRWYTEGNFVLDEEFPQAILYGLGDAG